MHREISHADGTFERQSNFPLYLVTALVGVLMVLGLWPTFADWALSWGVTLPTWSREVAGYQIIWLAAILGGARIAFNSFESLLNGRFGADLAVSIACIAALLIREPLVAAE